MHRVTEGMVETYELLAFPMACRWGQSLVGVYVAETATRYNLVDTIFRSTNEGILALATIRNTVSGATDFQIVAFNEGAAEMLGVEGTHLQWCRLSELPLGSASLSIRDRLIGSIGTGQFDQFELAFERGSSEVHINVSVASVGDLLSMTLTDIGDLKRREASFRLLVRRQSDADVAVRSERPADPECQRCRTGALRLHARPVSVHDRCSELWPSDEWEIHREIARSVGDKYQSERSWRHVKADGGEIEVAHLCAAGSRLVA